MTEATKTAPRYYVHTVTSGVGNKVRNPHRVIDGATGSEVDEYASKKAATMHAQELNRADRK
jgi:hypothetical protein